jgi:hypothetical protein
MVQQKVGVLPMTSRFKSDKAIGDTDYKPVIQILEGYQPELSCREHMLRDLPQVLRSPKGTLSAKMPLIVQDSEAIAQSRLQAVPPDRKLPWDEALAVISYTYDLLTCTEEEGNDNLYVVLNEMLRLRKPDVMAKLKPYLAYLMRGLQALPAVQTTCYRGVPPEHRPLVEAKYSKGTYVHWSGFTSCTPHLESAKNFAKQPGGVIFCIDVQSARNLQDYSAFPQEKELLLSPNVRMVVTQACRLEKDGYYFINLLELRQDAVIF